ncbi:MAG: hypothetical protein KIT20_00200 [Alphaproteobacteria bacterium]|nr:hypothetical protein [Alphaproteobacteria bacterium]
MMTTYTKSPTITGTSRNDTLKGTAGDDVIWGGGGDDVMDGGEGSDVYLVGGLGDGFNTFKDSGKSGYDVVAATEQGTRIGLASVFGPANGIEEITANGLSGVYIEAPAGSARLDFSATRLTGIERIEGGRGHDTIVGSAGDDYILGGQGNDALQGGRGNDTLDGGAGNDMAVFIGRREDYEILRFEDGTVRVTGLRNLALEDGSDLLIGIETIRFGDQVVSVGKLPIHVVNNDFEASTPSLSVVAASGKEDQPIALNIQAALTDTDGSETLAIVISGVPAGAKLSAGTDMGNGVWSLNQAQLAGLTLTPPKNSDADFALKVTAVATESNGGATASAEAVLAVAVEAVADLPDLAVKAASGQEDQAVALDIQAALTDTDGSEILSVRIDGLPAGASLSAGSDLGDGSWVLTPADLANLKFNPPANWAGEATLQVVATAMEKNGGSTASRSASLLVVVAAVADMPLLQAQNASGQAGEPIALDLSASLTDTDGSESLHLVVGGLPEGAGLSAGTKQTDGTWRVEAGQIAGLALLVPADFSGTIQLSLQAVASEANGSTAVKATTVEVTVSAAPQPEPAPEPAPEPEPVDDSPPAPVFLSPKVTILGTSSADNLTGTAGDDVIRGQGGNDTMNGGEGSDTYLVSGVWDGFNTYNDTGTTGYDQILALSNGTRIGFASGFGPASGIERISANGYSSVTVTTSASAVALDFSQTILDGDIKVVGSGGNDTITGSKASDYIVGGWGNDVILGGAGNDTIEGGYGTDTLDGGEGSDTYIFRLNDGNFWDTISDTGAAGHDVIVGAEANTAIRLASGFGPGNGIEEITGLGNSGVHILGSGNADFYDFSATKLTGIEKIDGGWGNDTIVGSKGDDTIDGGNGTDTVVYKGNYSDYGLVKQADGSWIIEAKEGKDQGEGRDTLLNMERVQFADQLFDLGTGAAVGSGGSSGGGTSSPSPSPAPAPSSGTIVRAPGVLQASEANDIVGMKLQNNGGEAEGAKAVTFGQVFAKGQLQPGTDLVARIGGVEYQVQMDVKATHADGSVRHAVLTMVAPPIPAQGELDIMLAAKSGPAGTAAAIQAGDILAKGYDLKVDFAFHNGDGSKTNVTVDVAQVLQQALADGSVKTWLSGAMASEFRVETWVTNDIRAVFDIRMTADGNIRTDVIMSNDHTFQPVQTVTYDVAIREGGETVYAKDAIAHYRNAMWHKEVWSEGQPAAHVVYDVNYMNQTGAIPTYDLSTGVTDQAIANMLAKLEASNTDPMGNALITMAMPMAGGRPDIGITPTWTANYLVTMDARALEIMLAVGDAAGSVPWHFRDEATGEAVRIDDHPTLWIDGRASGSGQLATPYDPKSVGWNLDNAHQPQLSYLPYLITGSQYHLDNMLHQGSFALGYTWNIPRLNDQGLLDVSETRAQAWAIRGIADAAYLTPDDHAMKDYFNTMVNNNLQHFYEKYVLGDFTEAGDVTGWINGYSTDGKTAPWMQDFVAMAMNTLVQRDFALSEELLAWQANFIAGRFINGDNGYDPMLGTGYYIQIFQHLAGGTAYFDPGKENSFNTWKEIFDATYATKDPLTDGLYQGNFNPDHYAAIAKGSLASVISGTGSPDAIEAYGWLIAHTLPLAKNFASDPHWNLAPKLADGSFLTYDRTHVATDNAGVVMQGTAASELLHGAAGNDAIAGGAGIDLLYGGDGNDTLMGGSGDDYLFGGAGDDRLIGGTGNDYLKGNSGKDTFVFAENGTGSDVIADFTSGIDKIELKQNLNGNGVTSAAQILTKVSIDADGNSVIDLGAGNQIILLGVQAGTLQASDFVFTA